MPLTESEDLPYEALGPHSEKRTYRAVGATRFSFGTSSRPCNALSVGSDAVQTEAVAGEAEILESKTVGRTCCTLGPARLARTRH